MTPLMIVADLLEADGYTVTDIKEDSKRGVVAFYSPCELDLDFIGHRILGAVMFPRREMDQLRDCWDERLVLRRVREAELQLEAELVL